MRQIQLMVGILISIILVGCQVEQQVDSHNNSITQIKQDKDGMIYGENGLPPLDDKLLDFYKEAYEFYQKYYMGSFEVDYNNMKVVNDLTYYQVNEDEFSSLEELEDKILFYRNSFK